MLQIQLKSGGGAIYPPSPLGPTALVRGLEWWTRMEKNVAKQNISDAIIITPYAQNKIPSKRFALNFVKKWVANSL